MGHAVAMNVVVRDFIKIIPTNQLKCIHKRDMVIEKCMEFAMHIIDNSALNMISAYTRSGKLVFLFQTQGHSSILFENVKLTLLQNVYFQICTSWNIPFVSRKPSASGVSRNCAIVCYFLK